MLCIDLLRRNGHVYLWRLDSGRARGREGGWVERERGKMMERKRGKMMEKKGEGERGKGKRRERGGEWGGKGGREVDIKKKERASHVAFDKL